MRGRSLGDRLVGLTPVATLVVFLLPVLAGLGATLLPALGVHPALGEVSPGLEPFRTFFALPGVGTSFWLTVRVGLLSAFLAFAISVLFCAGVSRTRAFTRARVLLSPLLAVPHSASAIGLAFLVAPSGWLFRLAAGPLGLERPPNVITVQDELGLSYVLAVLLKAVPYLILMIMAALGQVRPERSLAVSRSLGYGPVAAWLKTVFPLVYGQIRLPVYAGLAFALSAVDVALIMAPNTPPPLAVFVLRLFNDKRAAMQLPGAAGAMVLFGVVLGCIGLWRCGEMLVGRFWGTRLVSGRRGGSGRGVQGGSLLCVGGMGALSLAGFVVLGIWSLAGWWRFPDMFPGSVSLRIWRAQLGGLGDPTMVTLLVGGGAVLLALALILGCLENEDRRDLPRPDRSLILLYIPLLVPQVSFLFGTQILFILAGVQGTWVGLIWSHLLFVLPYMFLSLADPWRSLDKRYARTAACLGASPVRVFFRVKLPMLLQPICVACAVGFSVSAGEYLPTLFAGAGRFATLTTEAVTLAAGGDRRVAAVYAFLQTGLPLLVYVAALWGTGKKRF